MENAPQDAAAAEPGAPGTGPVWRFLVQPRWLAWHAFAAASFAGMCLLGDWQFHRAMSGNGLSWAYTFEWPLFAVFAVVFWAKTVRDEFRIRRGEMPATAVLGTAADLAGLPPGAGLAATVVQAGAAEPGEEDEELSAYNAYLARLNAEVKDHGRWHGLR
jgi:hypothetical protein